MFHRIYEEISEAFRKVSGVTDGSQVNGIAKESDSVNFFLRAAKALDALLLASVKKVSDVKRSVYGSQLFMFHPLIIMTHDRLKRNWMTSFPLETRLCTNGLC